MLGRWNPVFEHLPVENMVYSNQQAYYDAIAASTAAGQCGPFIDFMLGEIARTPEKLRGAPGEKEVSDKLPDKLPDKVPDKRPDKLALEYPQVSETAWSVYRLLVERPQLSAEAMGSRLGLSGRRVREHLARLREQGLIEREGSRKTGRWVVKG